MFGIKNAKAATDNHPSDRTTKMQNIVLFSAQFDWPPEVLSSR